MHECMSDQGVTLNSAISARPSLYVYLLVRCFLCYIKLIRGTFSDSVRRPQTCSSPSQLEHSRLDVWSDRYQGDCVWPGLLLPLSSSNCTAGDILCVLAATHIGAGLSLNVEGNVRTEEYRASDILICLRVIWFVKLFLDLIYQAALFAHLEDGFQPSREIPQCCRCDLDVQLPFSSSQERSCGVAIGLSLNCRWRWSCIAYCRRKAILLSRIRHEQSKYGVKRLMGVPHQA